MDTGYTFAVMAFNKLGESGYSVEVQGNTASESISSKIMVMNHDSWWWKRCKWWEQWCHWWEKNGNIFDNFEKIPTSVCFSKVFPVLRGGGLKFVNLGFNPNLTLALAFPAFTENSLQCKPSVAAGRAIAGLNNWEFARISHFPNIFKAWY